MVEMCQDANVYADGFGNIGTNASCKNIGGDDVIGFGSNNVCNEYISHCKDIITILTCRVSPCNIRAKNKQEE